MILDGIVGLFAGLVEVVVLLVVGMVEATILFINLGAAAVELVAGLFVSGFTLGRLKRKKKEKESDEARRLSPTEIRLAIAGGIIAVLIVAWTVLAPQVLNRKLSLVAEDGHSLPFAAVVLHTSHGDEHRRTDNAGNIVVTRFSTNAITIKDPRYVEQTWKDDEFNSPLVVRRTVLGSGLDVLAGKLLSPADDQIPPAGKPTK
jgi:amino acid transporter